MFQYDTFLCKCTAQGRTSQLFSYPMLEKVDRFYFLTIFMLIDKNLDIFYLIVKGPSRDWYCV